MRTPFYLATAALLASGVSACAQQGVAPESVLPQSQSIVSGELTYRERIALPPNSVATVTLSDISLADAPSRTIAERRMELGRQQVPIPFELTFDSGELQPRRRYAVRGTIHGPDGALLWTTDTNYAVNPNVVQTHLGPLTMVRVNSESAEAASDNHGLVGNEWIIEDIDNSGIIDRSRVTMNFGADGRLSGSASCNRLTGSYALSGSMLSVGTIAVTRMACAPALMNQEQRFLEILGDVSQYRFDDTGALIVSTSDGRDILARR